MEAYVAVKYKVSDPKDTECIGVATSNRKVVDLIVADSKEKVENIRFMLEVSHPKTPSVKKIFSVVLDKDPNKPYQNFKDNTYYQIIKIEMDKPGTIFYADSVLNY